MRTRSARISIMAGGSASRPDTLKQTDQLLISKTLLQTGRAITFFKRRAALQARRRGMAGLRLLERIVDGDERVQDYETEPASGRSSGRSTGRRRQAAFGSVP